MICDDLVIEYIWVAKEVYRDHEEENMESMPFDENLKHAPEI